MKEYITDLAGIFDSRILAAAAIFVIYIVPAKNTAIITNKVIRRKPVGGIRNTRNKTRDDIMISMPNSIIANTKIINESAPVPNFRTKRFIINLMRLGYPYHSLIEQFI